MKDTWETAREVDKLAWLVRSTGGTVTVDVKTNVLREIIEEHAPEEHEAPIPLKALGAKVAAGRHVIQDLLPDGQLVTLDGEEGEASPRSARRRNAHAGHPCLRLRALTTR
jgi:hypothetical protein